MKRYCIILLISLTLFGCMNQQPKASDKIIVNVNNYEIGLKEFKEDFKDSSYAREDSLESRKAFLENLINRKLILQEAQRQNLDKEEGFLRMIKKFWEQSLLKVALEKKLKDTTNVSDSMVEEAYNKLLKDGQADKPYAQMYQKIKWDLTKKREAQALEKWIDSLRKQSSVTVNYDLLRK